ncbi:uncharacterized protein LOC143141706 [Alosa pseudoharengus]|uniref:uncharacterized protein LOC143141706 n=1 Tax=Alosa pseudoharengus TaxID=34774 RepID=UPI003F8B6E95
MASPAKRARSELETAVGYVHSVSPIKMSKRNVRYFEATLQTGREEYHRLVAFSADKRQAFAQSSLAKRSVKLANVRKTVSYSDPTGYDVLFSSASGLDAVETAPFIWREPPGTTRQQISDVLALGPRQKVSELHAKILADGVVSRVVSVDGTMKELREFGICDRSGQTKLTLWESSILDVKPSKSFKLCHLVTRKSGDLTVLTSTPITTATAIEDVGEPDSLEPLDDSSDTTTTLRGCVSAVYIAQKQRCRRCHKNQEEFPKRCTTHRCEGCKMLQKSPSFQATYSGSLELTCDGEDHSVSLPNSAIWSYATQHLGDSVNEAEVIEEHLLCTGNIEVHVNCSGLTLSIEPLPETKKTTA